MPGQWLWLWSKLIITITILKQEEADKTGKDLLHCVPITHDSLRLVDQVVIIAIVVIMIMLMTIR